jgi:hypothetical protein
MAQTVSMLLALTILMSWGLATAASPDAAHVAQIDQGARPPESGGLSRSVQPVGALGAL